MRRRRKRIFSLNPSSAHYWNIASMEPSRVAPSEERPPIVCPLLLSCVQVPRKLVQVKVRVWAISERIHNATDRGRGIGPLPGCPTAHLDHTSSAV